MTSLREISNAHSLRKSELFTWCLVLKQRILFRRWCIFLHWSHSSLLQLWQKMRLPTNHRLVLRGFFGRFLFRNFSYYRRILQIIACVFYILLKTHYIFFWNFHWGRFIILFLRTIMLIASFIIIITVLSNSTAWSILVQG